MIRNLYTTIPKRKDTWPRLSGLFGTSNRTRHASPTWTSSRIPRSSGGGGGATGVEAIAPALIKISQLEVWAPCVVAF